MDHNFENKLNILTFQEIKKKLHRISDRMYVCTYIRCNVTSLQLELNSRESMW